MTLDYDALREVWRKTGDSERFAKADVQATPDTCYAVTFTPHELHALNELLAEGLTEPDHHEGNYAANLAGGRVGDQPMQDPYGRYARPEEKRYDPRLAKLEAVAEAASDLRSAENQFDSLPWQDRTAVAVKFCEAQIELRLILDARLHVLGSVVR